MSGFSPTRYVTIEEECKRNPKLRISDLQILKDWMDKQPHLPKIEMFYLILFLHSNYYQMEATKKTIEHFFTVRTHMPEIFSNRDPVACKGLRKTFNVAAIVPLEQETKEGYIMTFGKLIDPNPSQFDHNECVKYMLMTCEVQNLIRGTSRGMVMVLDASHFSFGHIARVNLMCSKKLLFYIQEASPVRLKAIHVLNAISAVDAFFNMIKPFIKAELLSFVHFHTTLDTVKEFLPIEALPNELGGKAGSMEEIVAKHITLLEEFREYFEYDELNGRVDESLRIGKCEATEDLFGVDGSFRKLDID